MGLVSHSDELLAEMWWQFEDAGDFERSDEYESEFFRRRRSRFAPEPYDPDATLALWRRLTEDAQSKWMRERSKT